jgi:3-phosphoshikimate 1-carboxyvinyltransferase
MMGARIQAREDQFPPLQIEGTQLTAIRYDLPVASAQVKSCVLLAGLMAQGRTSVIETTATRDHTERALPHFGAPFQKAGTELRVTGPSDLQPTDMVIPGDVSSAVFFIVAALLVKGARIRIPAVGINSTRAGLLMLLERSGARIEKQNQSLSNSEPSCDLIITHSDDFLNTFPKEIGGSLIPNVIDEIPILAVMGTRLSKGLVVRDAAELRKKESDRIVSIVTNLRQLGISVEEYPDGFQIPPGQQIRGGRITTFADHRIAMAFSIAGLLSSNGVEIDDTGCVDVSFPGFYDELFSLSR